MTAEHKGPNPNHRRDRMRRGPALLSGSGRVPSEGSPNSKGFKEAKCRKVIKVSRPMLAWMGGDWQLTEGGRST